MSEIEKLKIKRKVIRSNLTKSITKIEKFLVEPSDETTENRVDCSKEFKEQLIEKEINLKSLNDAFENLCDISEMESGMAASYISGFSLSLSLTEANYDVALDLLKRRFDKELQSRERTFLFPSKTENRTYQNFSREGRNNFKKSEQPKQFKNDRFMQGVNYTSSPGSSCVFCGSTEHKFCEFGTVVERKNKLKLENRCFRCFSKFHLARFCRAKLDPAETVRARFAITCFVKGKIRGVNLPSNVQILMRQRDVTLACRGQRAPYYKPAVLLPTRRGKRNWKFKIAFSADIEKAFLMISIAEENRKFLKFLWFPDNCYENVKFMRMTRLPFGCKTSPFILSAAIKGHIRQFREDKSKSVEMLDTSLYVDDLYFGAKDIYEAYELSRDAVMILKAAGMNLRKLNTNCKNKINVDSTGTCSK
ncbi:uncharacterized protein TNCV_1737181 [Trichonephila clavipes]|nr:uncharacterized protein TNCV_1737181 [Trichonephila clavipes]